MKKLLAFAAAAMLLSGSLHAQESKLYLVFELWRSKTGRRPRTWRRRISGPGFTSSAPWPARPWDGISGALEPSGADQGYQYLTVNLFGSMEAMLKRGAGGALMAHAKRAYPKMTEPELTAKFNATSETRELAVRLFLEQIDTTTGGTEMKEGTIALITSMMAKDPSYEKMESEVFKPLAREDGRCRREVVLGHGARDTPRRLRPLCLAPRLQHVQGPGAVRRGRRLSGSRVDPGHRSRRPSGAEDQGRSR